MKTTEDQYRTALLQAALVLDGWMSRFPAPDCHEQAEVVAATQAWLSDVKHLVND